MRTGKNRAVPEPNEPDDAESRTTEDAAGAPAGDRDLDELLDDADPASE